MVISFFKWKDEYRNFRCSIADIAAAGYQLPAGKAYRQGV